MKLESIQLDLDYITIRDGDVCDKSYIVDVFNWSRIQKNMPVKSSIVEKIKLNILNKVTRWISTQKSNKAYHGIKQVEIT